MKKFTPPHSLITIIICVVVILFSSCKKSQTVEVSDTSSFVVEQFFKNTNALDAPTQKIVNYLKKQQLVNPKFIPNLVSKCGYPVWNKSRANYIKTTTGRTTTEGAQDTIIQLPFVQQSTTVVNSYIEALINDTIKLDLFEKYKYTILPKGAIDATNITAEKYINQFFMLQNSVFDHHFFKIIDSTLFKSFLPNATGVVKYINIEQVSNNGTQTNSFGVDGCYHYTTSYNTYTDNGIVCHKVHHTWCPLVPVMSLLSTDGGSGVGLGTASGLGSLGTFTGSGGTGVGSSANGNTPVYTPPSYGNNNGTNNEVAFIDADQNAILLAQVENYLGELPEDDQAFLMDHPIQMQEILNYLFANNTQDAKDKVMLHINKMQTDADYLNLVINHSNTSTNVKVWWDDQPWYSNPVNEQLLNPSNKPFWLIEFPIDVPDVPIINNGITISEIDPTIPPINNGSFQIASTVARGNIEDLTFGTNGDATGIDANVVDKADNILKAGMNTLFSGFTIFDWQLKQVGESFIDLFYNNSNNALEASNATVESRVKESGVFKNFLNKFGSDLSKALKLTNGDINTVPFLTLPYRPTFNSLYHKFHGLQILINDTEYTKIDIDNYKNMGLGSWEANVTVTIYDHFGLDKNDALTYQSYHSGFASWWVLQHKRGKAPFIHKITIKNRISGNWFFQ